MDTKKWCKPSELACKRSGIRQIVLSSPEFLIYWYQWHDCKWFKPMVNSQVREKETSWQNLSGANAIKRRPHVPAKFTKQAHRRKQFGSCRWGARLRVESGGGNVANRMHYCTRYLFFFTMLSEGWWRSWRYVSKDMSWRYVSAHQALPETIYKNWNDFENFTWARVLVCWAPAPILRDPRVLGDKFELRQKAR